MSFITADSGSDQSNFVQSMDNSRVYMRKARLSKLNLIKNALTKKMVKSGNIPFLKCLIKAHS